jgi:diguanylate cyclase (GGDEF)-like protein
MTPELEQKLARCGTLPSPPSIASRILDLAQDPDVGLGEVGDAIARDPALTAKILRIANSALYGQRRQCGNLRQALVLLGVDATLTVALSFALFRGLRGAAGGLSYPGLWRRALLTALAGRLIGTALRRADTEQLFLAGLLQDIGVLALARVMPEVYVGLDGEHFDHAAVVRLEREATGSDHAEVGAWLLHQWAFPEHLQAAVAASHDPTAGGADPDRTVFLRSVACAADLADLYIAPQPRAIAEVARRFEGLVGLDAPAFYRVLEAIREQGPDVQGVFEADLIDEVQAELLLEQARDTLTLRNLRAIESGRSLARAQQELEARTRDLELQSRRDALTGLFNRAYLDQVLGEEFARASRHGWPLTVLFIDLDHFKRVNDTHGHAAGDRVLEAAAELLRRGTRDGDLVARYGGEEFVVVLPGSNLEAGATVADRLLEGFHQSPIAIGPDKRLAITASIGVASHGGERVFATPLALVQAADEAMYRAKAAGRDRVVAAGLE